MSKTKGFLLAAGRMLARHSLKAYFICVLIFLSAFVINHWEEYMAVGNLEELSVRNIMFFAFIVFLFIPFVSSIKIGNIIEVTTKYKRMNSKLESITNEKKLEIALKRSLSKTFDILNQIKNQQVYALPFGKIGLQPDKLFANGGTDEQLDIVSDNVSFFENAKTLKASLKKKHENIISHKYNKDSMYNALNKVCIAGIDKMNDSLTEDEFKTWTDDSIKIIEQEKTKINFYENYSSLVECLVDTDLPPCQKLNSCIDYSLDVMKYMAETK